MDLGAGDDGWVNAAAQVGGEENDAFEVLGMTKEGCFRCQRCAKRNSSSSRCLPGTHLVVRYDRHLLPGFERESRALDSGVS